MLIAIHKIPFFTGDELRLNIAMVGQVVLTYGV